MIKPIIIIGKPDSGKSFLAKNIALAFKEVTWIDGTRLPREQRFPFHTVSKATDLIIIDDIPKKEVSDVAFKMFADRMYIEKQGEERFEIKTPHVILISDSEDEIVGSALRRRYTIIRTWITSQENGFPMFNMTKLT